VRRSAPSAGSVNECVEEGGIKRIERDAGQCVCLRPEVGQRIDPQGRPSSFPQQVVAPLPILEAKSVALQHVVAEDHALAASPAPEPRHRGCPTVRHAVCPTVGTSQFPTKAAHERSYRQRGWRRAKSSAISSMVRNLTPGWRTMWLYSRSSIIKTCGRPDTSGWMVIGNTA